MLNFWAFGTGTEVLPRAKRSVLCTLVLVQHLHIQKWGHRDQWILWLRVVTPTYPLYCWWKNDELSCTNRDVQTTVKPSKPWHKLPLLSLFSMWWQTQASCRQIPVHALRCSAKKNLSCGCFQSKKKKKKNRYPWDGDCIFTYMACVCYGFYHDKSPPKTTIRANMFFTFSNHLKQIQAWVLDIWWYNRYIGKYTNVPWILWAPWSVEEWIYIYIYRLQDQIFWKGSNYPFLKHLFFLLFV